ncbi:MAG: hypothetical protein U5O16_38125 [Rhodococcus sp. (in: high G+C Gram-positive bacteria)]|uniref:hypothetical protein n=1 Tax=Rhodococcus sp. TaxID=1831 RepID=UPI002AD874D9|nr:hypothetical protein [Rhodococcus sp. (in: high G+C Gram-positive bacteria)]
MRSFASRHPIWTTLGGLLLLGFVLEYWWMIAGLAAVAAIIYGCIGEWENLQLRRAADRQRQAELAARATYEHEMYIRGDDTGIYGQYSPATRPDT